MPNARTEELLIEFRLKVHELERICKVEGVTILVYCGLRTCDEQARLYRQSRGRSEIQQKQQSLVDRGLPFLAEIIDTVGPQPGTLGKHVTKAGPGESWHQYAGAADCVPLKNGKAMWANDDPGWEIYGAVAEHLDLNWAGNWPNFKEMPHIQLSNINNPITFYKDPDKIRAVLTRANSFSS